MISVVQTLPPQEAVTVDNIQKVHNIIIDRRYS